MDTENLSYLNSVETSVDPRSNTIKEHTFERDCSKYVNYSKLSDLLTIPCSQNCVLIVFICRRMLPALAFPGEEKSAMWPSYSGQDPPRFNMEITK